MKTIIHANWNTPNPCFLKAEPFIDSHGEPKHKFSWVKSREEATVFEGEMGNTVLLELSHSTSRIPNNTLICV